MHAAQAIEQRLVERLHAHGNAVHAEVPEQPGFVERYRGGIAFNRPLGRAQQSQTIHRVEDLFPLTEIEQGRRAAAEKDRARLEFVRDPLQFAEKSRNVAIYFFARSGFGIKRTVRALLRAERHMDIEAVNGTRW